MQLAAGTRLGTYEIVDLLGAGGMGEVYRARDVRLGRLVALKVLSSCSTRDPQFTQRFEEEARSACVLNHPNIVTIYGVGEDADAAFIAMELVEGRTLRDAMAGRALPVKEAIDIAAQLAEALAAAHEAGIVHRDLKPENVMMTPDGVAKVLDFGLAKRQAGIATAGGGSDETRMMLTQEGAILGTVGYMSPEQAAGQPAGPASDQFAFGLVLYEMLAGRRAFDRPTIVETLHAIMRDEPPPLTSAPAASAALLPVLARCLAKNPAERYASTRDLALEMGHLRDRSRVPAGLSALTTDPRPARMTRRHAIWIGVAALAVAAGLTAWRWPHAPASPGDTGIRTLAVLPFDNVGRDAEVEYLCDGITESLIRRISRLKAFSVKSRSAVFNFKGQHPDPQAAGGQLAVQAILTGTVSRQGPLLHITAELVDVRTGNVLWSSKAYDRPAASLLTVQDDIATAIVDQGLRAQLTGEDRSRLAQRPTDNPDAYEQFLRGRQLEQQKTQEGYLKARALFQSAVKLDPNFALAFVALAGTYGVTAVDGYEPPAEAWPKAREAAERALELDPELADAKLALLGEFFFFKWRWAAAEAQGEDAMRARGAVESDLLIPYALERWALGDPEKGVVIAKRARDLDPLSPALTVTYADFLLKARRLEEARAIYQQVIKEHDDESGAYFGLAEVRRTQKRFDEAIAALRRGHELVGQELPEEVLRNARGEPGYWALERAAVRQQLDQAEQQVKAGSYVSSMDLARLHALLGDKERALSYFPAAFAERAPGLVFLNVDRAWEGLRDDPRFRDAVKRVGLPEIRR